MQLQRHSEQHADLSTNASEAFRIFTRFESLLEQSYAETRSVAALARELGCSEKTLSRACNAVAGASPKELILRRVVLDAKRVLVFSNSTVKEISIRLGFSEPTNFVKFFRRQTGMLPLAFRDRARTAPALWRRFTA
jgi:AraC-like DNA-binding protein